MNKHLALYISNKDNKHLLIEQIVSGVILHGFANLRGAVFSEITLNKFIDEEMRHGNFDVITETKSSLQKSSEGERKKALLNHIISKKPEYIIVDNVFGNLDSNSQKTIEETLTSLSSHTSIIQIANRKRDFLGFIKEIYQLHEGVLILMDDFNESNKKENKTFFEVLPKPYIINREKINPLIKFNNVTVSYGDRTIAKDISWEIKKGEFWQLLGPNGSGKSTLLSLITGDNVKGYNKDVTLFGVKKGSGESIWDIKKKIGYFSSEMLRGFKRLDSIGNMIVSGFFDTIGLYKQPTNQQIKIAQQWLHVLEMFDIRKQSFLSLSKGHQSLVLVARALVKHPPLLILDEPTNGLDDDDAELFTKLINKIAKESDIAILYVSHRKEDRLLNPDFIYELIASPKGSIGRVV